MVKTTKKATYYTACTVLRTYKTARGTLNMSTGERTMGEWFTETGPCNSPLFSTIENKTGVCKHCAKGEPGSEDNDFANETERKRAVAAHANNTKGE